MTSAARLQPSIKGCVGHSPGFTHCLQTVAGVFLLQCSHEVTQQPASGSADGVSECNCTTKLIDPLFVNAEVFLPGEHDGRECLVHLEGINIVNREMCAAQQFFRGWDDARQHHQWIVTAYRKGLDARPGHETEPYCRRFLCDKNRTCPVRNLAGVASADGPVDLREPFLHCRILKCRLQR